MVYAASATRYRSPVRMFCTALASICAMGCQVATVPDVSDIVEDPGVSVSVEGTYRWYYDVLSLEYGTIAFAQDGARVSVTRTFHAAPGNRELTAEGELQGNRLTLRFVPKNGDTDYVADVTFLFSPDGSRFRAEFSDTNGDAGAAAGERDR